MSSGNLRDMETFFGGHGVKIQSERFYEGIFEILILSGDNKQRKLSCLQKIASCLPSTKWKNIKISLLSSNGKHRDMS